MFLPPKIGGTVRAMSHLTALYVAATFFTCTAVTSGRKPGAFNAMISHSKQNIVVPSTYK